MDSKFPQSYYNVSNKKELYYKTVYTILMPTFLDMIGLKDDNLEEIWELLCIVLSGKINEKELLSEI